MITKERLEELIKENKKVYYTQNHPLTEDAVWIDLTGAEIIPSQECVALSYKIYNNYGYVNCFPFKWLYETKEDAEFALSYKRIPKTEYLDLPTWEEFCELDKLIVNYEFQFFGNDKVIYLLYFIDHKEISVWNLMEGKVEFNKKATKENYIKACELCKKLFLGEEV